MTLHTPRSTRTYTLLPYTTRFLADRASASYITGLQLFTGFETMFAAQFDLFGTPILPGFHYGETIVTADEERALIASIDSAGLSPFRFQGWFGQRLTASFGWRHDFDTARFEIGSAHVCTPVPNAPL